jgi:hypothetical protein
MRRYLLKKYPRLDDSNFVEKSTKEERQVIREILQGRQQIYGLKMKFDPVTYKNTIAGDTFLNNVEEILSL